MSFINYSYVHFYVGAGAGFGFASSGTLDDGQAGTTFETSDTTMDDSLFLDGIADTFIGTWTDSNAQVFYIVQDTAGDHYLYGPAAAIPSFPNTYADVQADGGFSTAQVTVQCFGAGTMIATPQGETAVEDLAIGDLVRTAEGQTAAVKFVATQTIAPRFAPAERLTPVRVAAGALGRGVPHRDLTLTADHALLIDGVLCNAGALVNGTTITRIPFAEMGESFTVYHVETDAHEIILAEGAPAETFIDNISRRGFDNFAEFEALYGDVPEMVELPYPRAMSPRQVPAAIQAKLSAANAA